VTYKAEKSTQNFNLKIGKEALLGRPIILIMILKEMGCVCGLDLSGSG
jgi:hypothetical protein